MRPGLAAAEQRGGTETGAVLRIQGETVIVPRRERRRPVRQEAQLTLESLTEAFNDVSPVPPAAEDKTPSLGNVSAGGRSAADSGVVAPAEEPARRPRRRRAARSPQGAADAQIIKAGSEDSSGAQGSSTTAVAAAPAAPRTEAAAPVILGVGVPASDL